MKVTSSSTSLAPQGKSLSRSETIKWLEICNQLASQGSPIPKVWENGLVCTKSNWFFVLGNMPKTHL